MAQVLQRASYNSGMVFPEASLKGLVRYAAGAAAGVPMPAVTMKWLEAAGKRVYGGLFAPGALTLTANDLHFKPSWAQRLVADGFEEMRIPVADMRSVTLRPYIVVRLPMVIIQTVNGEVRIISFLAAHKFARHIRRLIDSS